MAEFGCWVWLFVRRSNAYAVKRLVEEFDEVTFRDDGTVQLRPEIAGIVDVDDLKRAWVSDMAAVQWWYENKGIDRWPELHSNATSVVRYVRRTIGDDEFIGATIVFLFVGRANESTEAEQVVASLRDVPQDVRQPVFTASTPPIEIKGFAISRYEEEFGLSTMLAVASRTLNDAETNAALVGLDGTICFPEVLGHKVSWLARQVLNSANYEAIKSMAPDALDCMKAMHAAITDPQLLAPLLDKASRKLVRLAHLQAVLQTNLGDLRLQREHLKISVEQASFCELHKIYLSRVEMAIRNIEVLNRELKVAHHSLLQIGTTAQAAVALADVKLEEARNERFRRAETWIAALGVGIGSAEIISEEFASGFIRSFQLEPNFLSVFAVRTILVVALSIIAFLLYPKTRSFLQARRKENG